MKKPPTQPVPALQDKFFLKVQAIIAQQLLLDAGEVTPSARFAEDLGADSLDTVELVMEFEDKFDLMISDEDAEEIKTVQNAVEYLRRKAKAASR